MLKYRGTKLIRAGLIGIVLIVLVITIGLQPQVLWSMASSLRYQALFTDAGGLSPGNDVKVSGVKMGLVSDVALSHGKALVTFTLDGKVRLGSDTTAHIRTGTVLGERMLTLEPAGNGTLHPQRRHPAIPDVVAILIDQRSQRLHVEHRRHRHRLAEPIPRHLVRDDRPDSTAIGADLRWPDSTVADP